MKIIGKETKIKELVKEAIDQKLSVFKRELLFLAESKNLMGWTRKMQGMLECMKEVL